MRAFVALEISDDGVLDSLLSFQRELGSAGANLKPVERQNLHFTLKFLGDIPDSQAQEADSRLKGLSLKGGTVTVAGVGAFPTARQPNVIWAGVSREDEAKVLSVAGPVVKALEGIGESDTRPFQAHVTIARVRPGGNRGGLGGLIAENAERTFGTYKLTTFRLKSSTLTPRGPIYADVGVYSLL